ncbi:hypothetical protein [Pyxidicoccus xibeiensis]|uniref:hypothetical protein n=1 Tax=Pyxidicoccus xibeiensis TaxID=2906759 RepID=UPI0020A8071E|nr:hypothetical protein [Pyxidicoccus xibeiensis]MCP3138804.1 hypothetical protein [Pyxidicoccus xibeiensis]
MKASAASFVLISATLLAATPADAGNWFACGNLTQIGWSCQLPSYPSSHYEYGVAYNSAEPQVTNCAYWNYGLRLINRHPYIIASDNPQTGSLWGGFIFYTSTLASDDDTCSGGSWRHQYWILDSNNAVKAIGSNGCAGSNHLIYCRAR